MGIGIPADLNEDLRYDPGHPSYAEATTDRFDTGGDMRPILEARFPAIRR